MCESRLQTIGQKLESAGYRCHWYGKGHTGFKSMHHLPERNGFSSGFLGFLNGNIYHTSTAHRWIGDVPFEKHAGAFMRFKQLPEREQYSTAHFGDTALDALELHNAREPLFMFMAWQDPHRPYDPPPGWSRREQSCDGIEMDTTDRRSRARTDACCMYGMISVMDEYVGRFTTALKEKSMWDNTLVIFVSVRSPPNLPTRSPESRALSTNARQDNGGSDAGVNYPLRGEKHTTWEGGIRGAALISGGVVPRALHGTVNGAVLSIADWYPTLCTLAGVDPQDDPPVKPDLTNLGDIYGKQSWPGVDGVNIWPALMGPSDQEAAVAHDFLPVTSEVLIAGRFKLVVAQPDPDLMENKVRRARGLARAGSGEVMGW